MLGMAGAIALIYFGSKGDGASGNAWGDLMILLNATSYGIYLVLVKPLMSRYQPLTIIKWVFLFGFIPVFFFGFQDFQAISWSTFTGNIWAAIVFVVVCTTFLAYLLNIYGLKHLSPAVVSTYIYLQPVMAAAVAIFLGKDHLDPIKIVATAMIFLGVYLVTKK